MHKQTEWVFDDPGFRVDWSPENHGFDGNVIAVRAKVYDVVYQDADGTKHCHDWDDSPEDEIPYLEAIFKWDSCCQVYFSPEDEGYLHMCGVDAFQGHVALMEYLYKKAMDFMGGPESGEEWE